MSKKIFTSGVIGYFIYSLFLLFFTVNFGDPEGLSLRERQVVDRCICFGVLAVACLISAIIKRRNVKPYLEKYRPYFTQEIEKPLRGKYFVISEEGYPNNNESQGAKIAGRLGCFGAVMQTRVSESTDYLVVSLKNIEGLAAYSFKKDADGKRQFVYRYNNDPSRRAKIDRAISLQRSGAKIKIISMDYLEKYLR